MYTHLSVSRSILSVLFCHAQVPHLWTWAGQRQKPPPELLQLIKTCDVSIKNGSERKAVWKEEKRSIEGLLVVESVQLCTRCFHAPLFSSLPACFFPKARPPWEGGLSWMQDSSEQYAPREHILLCGINIFAQTAAHCDMWYTSMSVIWIQDRKKAWKEDQSS